jgi:hypothetical protein
VRVPTEIEAALAGSVRVRVEGDVGDRRCTADEPLPRREVMVHRGERLGAVRQQARQPPLVPLPRQLRVRHEEASDRDRRLVLVLLEEEPLQHLRALVPVGRHPGRVVAEVPEDRVRLGERPPVVEHDRRYPPCRVELVELVTGRRAVDDLDLACLVGDAEVREQQPDLVAIARDRAVEEDHPLSAAPKSGRRWSFRKTPSGSRVARRARKSPARG